MSKITTLNLLDMIKRRSFMPASSITFTDLELLAIADEEIQTVLTPMLMSVKEDYFVDWTDFSVTENIQTIDIPHRSIGLKVKEIHFISSSGQIKNLPRRDVNHYLSTTATGEPEAFSIEANQIKLWPIPATTTGTIRVYLFLRPNSLIETSSSLYISSFDSGNGTIDVPAIPSGWTSSLLYDVISKDGGHPCREFDMVCSLVSGDTFTFSTALPSYISIGDELCISETTGLVQLPPEFVPILAQSVSVQILEATSQPGASVQRDRLKMMLDQAQKTITGRVEGELKTIRNRWI